MGESAFMPPAFSYTSSCITNEASQGNPMDALKESVSFGRFVSDSLAWEKWSSFSQKRHVEEAEKYAQPGSVAQKKAFFEAHYKKIAAMKAAALLEQANAASNSSEPVAEEQQELTVNSDGLNSDTKPVELEVGNVGIVDLVTKPEVLVEIPVNVESLDLLYENLEDKNMVSELESTGTPQMKKPLLKDVSRSVSKKRAVLSSLRSTVFCKVKPSPAKSVATLNPRKENNFTPRTVKSKMDSADKKKSTPKSLCKSINFAPDREPDKLTTPAIRKSEGSRIAPTYTTSKDSETPLRTPITVSVNGVPKHPSKTPGSENKSCSKSFSACRKKLQSSTISTPFTLRTESRAASRKQKLEERFNEKQAQKVQMQAELKEKAEIEVRKLRESLCFRARPLPQFYRGSNRSKDQINKTPEMHTQSPKPGPSTIEDSNPLTKSTTKSNTNIKNVLNNNSQTPVRALAPLPKMTPHRMQH